MLYLAVDGGGSKLRILLFDDVPRRLSFAVSDGTHYSVYTKQEVEHHIKECYRTLFASVTPPCKIDTIYLISGHIKPVLKLLPPGITVDRTVFLGEGPGGMLAGAVKKTGFLSLSGTGSDCFCIKDGIIQESVGGYGALLGDEGSGVWMSLEAFRAAIRSEEGWGEKTDFGRRICDRYHLSCLREYISVIYGMPAPYRKIAELLPTVAEAANEGDAEMIKIFLSGGERLARQTEVLVCRHPELAPDVTACGGAWKSHPLFAESFLRSLQKKVPKATLSLPLFEHIMAGPAELLLSRGEPQDKVKSILRKEFRDFCLQ